MPRLIHQSQLVGLPACHSECQRVSGIRLLEAYESEGLGELILPATKSFAVKTNGREEDGATVNVDSFNICLTRTMTWAGIWVWFYGFWARIG
ncbi:hypothetical protein Tco_0956673 [Tanacetum coccineum]